MSTQYDTMRQLIAQLNEASDAYYNGRGELMTDYEWDALFDQLKQLEEESGEILPDSPTQKVSEDAIPGQKERHEFPALSLAKTKKTEDLVKWAEGRPIWVSWKLDGLTLVATYDGGKLTRVLTRGGGDIGTNITHLAKAISGLPQTIQEKGHLVIRGEAVISYADFEQFLMESDEDYANPRNLASGSLSLKDPEEVKKRRIRWIPFTLVYTEYDKKTGSSAGISAGDTVKPEGQPVSQQEVGRELPQKETELDLLQKEAAQELPQKETELDLPQKEAAQESSQKEGGKDLSQQESGQDASAGLNDPASWGARMDFLAALGFQPVEREIVTQPDEQTLQAVIGRWTEKVTGTQKAAGSGKAARGVNPYPVDGLVINYEDNEYAATGSVTGHHATRAGYAFKWQDESADSILDHIEWSCAASTITPVAVFAPVELEGTTVQRASLCNISECERLGIGGPGTQLSVIKANKIIPKVIRVGKAVGKLEIPQVCPVCGAGTQIHVNEFSETRTLRCTNPECTAKQLKKFTRFVSKTGMDIDGISEQTLARFINAGWVKEYADLYHLPEHREEIIGMDGFGEKSMQNLEAALEKSRQAVPRQLLFALCIPLCGQEVAKLLLSRYPIRDLIQAARDTADPEVFSDIDGIGPEKSASFVRWMQNEKNAAGLDRLLAEITLQERPARATGMTGAAGDAGMSGAAGYAGMSGAAGTAGMYGADGTAGISGAAGTAGMYGADGTAGMSGTTRTAGLYGAAEEGTGARCAGLTFVVTGEVHHYKNRNELKDYIESQGGKVTSAVSGATSFLINNDVTSTSGKNQKAKKLGIPIISEDEFLKRYVNQ